MKEKDINQIDENLSESTEQTVTVVEVVKETVTVVETVTESVDYPSETIRTVTTTTTTSEPTEVFEIIEQPVETIRTVTTTTTTSEPTEVFEIIEQPVETIRTVTTTTTTTSESFEGEAIAVQDEPVINIAELSPSEKVAAAGLVRKRSGALVSSKATVEKQKAVDYINEISKRFKQKTLRGHSMLNKILGMVVRGSNKASQHNVLESLKIDDEWLKYIEGHLNNIANIVRNPKSALIDERIIVNTSKAKRTDSMTVRYLSSHTGDIESIKDDEVRPSRLNVKEIDQDLAIYENRFVYALLVRIRSFLEQRYIAIKDQLNCYDTNELKVQSQFDTTNGDVQYELSVKVRDKMSDSVSVKENASLLERIETCRTHVSAFMSSEFARTLSKAKLLMPPINKTNVIRMHTDYKACYNLWLFLSSYTAVGYSIKVEEQDMELTSDYYDDLAFIVSMSVKNMMDNNMINRSVFGKGNITKKIKQFKPAKSFTYSPVKRNIAKKADADLINQFYYDKIKSLLKSSEEVKSKKDEPLRVAFRTYYRSINTLNNHLYNEALELDNYRKTMKNTNDLETNEQFLSLYEEGYKRIKLLKSLKEKDYKSIENEERKYLEKVAKLRVKVKEIKDKQLQDIMSKRLEAQRIEFEKRERKRETALEKQRLAQEKREQLIIERLEKQRKAKEAREKMIIARLEEKQRITEERELEKIALLAARQKEREQLNKERAKIAEAEKRRKLREKEKQRKQKERQREKEKLLKEKQKEKETLLREKEKQRVKKEPAQPRKTRTKTVVVEEIVSESNPKTKTVVVEEAVFESNPKTKTVVVEEAVFESNPKTKTVVVEEAVFESNPKTKTVVKKVISEEERLIKEQQRLERQEAARLRREIKKQQELGKYGQQQEDDAPQSDDDTDYRPVE